MLVWGYVSSCLLQELLPGLLRSRSCVISRELWGRAPSSNHGHSRVEDFLYEIGEILKRIEGLLRGIVSLLEVMVSGVRSRIWYLDLI